MKRRILPQGAWHDGPRQPARIEPLDQLEERVRRWRRRFEHWILRPLLWLLVPGLLFVAWRTIHGLCAAGVLS